MNHLSYEYEEEMTSVTAGLLWDLDPLPFHISVFLISDSLPII